MKGYKAFNKDLTCRGFQYEVGHTYEMDDKPIICKKGFHFCKQIGDTYKFYRANDETRICEVEAFGDIVTEDNIKFCTNKIKIIREITDPAQRKANTDSSNSGFCNSGGFNSGNYNSGEWNSGNYNSGNSNSGSCNSGNYNSGNWNSGDCNSGNYNSGNYNYGNYNYGNYNSGNYNSGNYNSGNYNYGNYNSGNWNSGDCNSGDCNSSSYNSGCFSTEEHKINMFDSESDWSYEDWNNSYAKDILCDCPNTETVLEWIYESDMTDEEKKANPTYKTTGGYLKVTKENGNRQEWWDHLTEEEKDEVKSLPNFDAEKFYICTGIKVNNP